MPVDKQVILRYKVLDELFRTEGKDFETLYKACNDALQNSGYQTVSRRTIQNDLHDLQTQCGAELDETAREGHKRLYRYKNPFCPPLFDTSNVMNVLNDTIEWMKTYDLPQYQWVTTMLSQIEEQVFLDKKNRYVEFQDNPNLKGKENFQKILNAIIEQKCLRIEYQPFHKDNAVFIDVHPYYLKQFNNRWYLICRSQESNKIFNLPLDRMKSLTPADQRYIPPQLDLQDYFKDVVGVTVTEEPPVAVKLRIDSKRYPYIETKTIHVSQELLKKESTKNFKTIRLKVKINKELESQILAFGDDVEIIEPKELREQLKSKIENMFHKYKEQEMK